MQKLNHQALIICTSGRLNDLSQTLQSLLRCTALPEHIIVVEGSSGPSRIFHILEQFSNHIASSGISVTHRKTVAHLTLQRNTGIRACTPDCRIIHFIDDDLSPASFYFTEISEHFKNHPACIMAGGHLRIKPDEITQPNFFRRFFLLDSLTPGKYLRSGQTSQFHGRTDVKGKEYIRTDWLSGCCMSFKSSVFNHIRFDENLIAEGMDEDLDISLQASRLGELHLVPAARAVHRLSNDARPSPAILIQRKLVNRFYILQKHRPGICSTLLYLWSCLGIMFALHYNHSSISDNKIGFWKGMKQVLGMLRVRQPALPYQPNRNKH